MSPCSRESTYHIQGTKATYDLARSILDKDRLTAKKTLSACIRTCDGVEFDEESG